MWITVLVALLCSLLALGLSVRGWAAGRRRRIDVDDMPADVAGLRAEVAALKAEAGAALRHVAVVRYDAFNDMGGHLSWSAALLDDAGDGMLLTSIHGRSEARTYAKTLTGWTCQQPLSAEESQAVESARPDARA